MGYKYEKGKNILGFEFFLPYKDDEVRKNCLFNA